MCTLDICAVSDRVAIVPHAAHRVRRTLPFMPTPAPLELTALDDLARRLLKGDAEALGAVYDRLAGALHALALERCGNADEADRVTEALFRELWHGRATLTDGARVWVPRLFVRCHQLAAPSSPRGGLR